jgi:hypothetical protein
MFNFLIRRLWIFVIFWLNASQIVLAQVEGISIVSAENYFLDKDFRNALVGFEDYLSNIKFDGNVAYKAGISACRLGIDKKAIAHLQSARDAGIKDNYLSYWLGRSFLQDNKWDSATFYLENYMEVFPVDRTFQNETTSFLKHIRVARTMLAPALSPIVIENLGPGINSPYSEFHPLLTADGQTMIVNSRKKGFLDEKLFDDGEFKEKIFVSKKQEDGTWSRAIPIRLNEGRNRDNDFIAIQLINNDTKLLLYKIVNEAAHMYVSDYAEGNFGLPYQIPIEPDPRFFTGDIVFTEDLKFCVFTSEGNTNYFQNDLYFSRYDDKNEKWTDPVSLGENINSKREEGSPFLIGDSILYFSSKADNGLGEFDIYRSVKDKEGKWGPAINLGFPYNTANNDLYFYRSQKDTSVHYVSSLRGSTKGLADIYKVRKTALAKAEGQITDGSGDLFRNTAFTFEDPENFQNIEVKTDADGRFSVELVAGVNYQISKQLGKDKYLDGFFRIPFPLPDGFLSQSQNIRLLPRVVVKPEVPADSVE